MEIELIAFLDESKKPVRDPRTRKVADCGDFYAVAAAVVLNGDLDQLRADLVALAADLGVQVHYNDLGRDRRIAVVERIVELDSWDGYLFETGQPLRARHNSEHRLRAKTLTSALEILGTQGGIRDLVLETRGKPSAGFTTLDDNDHRTLASLRSRGRVPNDVAIRHETKNEPLLWLADVLAGTRTDHLCGLHLDIYPRLAHRVRDIHAVLSH